MLKNPCLGGNKYKDFLIKANILLPPGGHHHGVHAWSVGATGRSEAGRGTNLAICHADRAGQYGRGQALQDRLLSFAFFNFSLIYEKF
jgi:hypothetical protein